MTAYELPRLSDDAGGGSGFRALRIVVVEDEGLVALQIETFLEAAGHVVLGAADDRASALELVRTVSSPPDLALVDIRLASGARGTDVAADLVARGIPVLFVTGNCPGERGRELALACLHKPFSQGELVAAVAVAQAVLQGHATLSLPAALHLY